MQTPQHPTEEAKLEKLLKLARLINRNQRYLDNYRSNLDAIVKFNTPESAAHHRRVIEMREYLDTRLRKYYAKQWFKGASQVYEEVGSLLKAA